MLQNAKSSIIVLQPVGANNAAANVMMSTNTETALVKNMSCADCGGDHRSAFRRCPKFQRAAQIQQVKKLSYAEAVLMVPKIKIPVNVVGSKTKTEGPVNVLTKPVGVQPETKDTEFQTERAITDVVTNISKEGFIGFITEVVNCTAQAENRSEKINIISAAAVRHLGWVGFSSKMMNKIFS